MRKTLLIVVVLVVLLVVSESEARRNRNKGRRRGDRERKCKYDKRSGQWSDCIDGRKSKTVNLVRNNNEGTCNQTKTLEKPCRIKLAKCKYDRRSGQWSDCIDGRKTKTLSLKPGRNNEGTCNQTKTIEKPCKIKPPRGCKYEKIRDWGDLECDPDTQMVSKTVNLIPGQSGNNCDLTWTWTMSCEKFQRMKEKINRKREKKAKKEAKKRAKKERKQRRKENKRANKQAREERRQNRRSRRAGCKYEASDWTPCNETSQTASRTMTLRRVKNDNITCEQNWTQTIHCDRLEAKLAKRQRNSGRREERMREKEARRERKRRKQEQRRAACKYSRPDEWGDCDVTTDTMMKTLTLLSGPDTCEQSVTLHRKCDKDCRYTHGDWGECNQQTHIKERTDTLKETVSKDFCAKTRKMTKKCGRRNKKRSRKGCVYNSGVWGDCDTTTNTRTKTKTLKTGNPTICVVEKTVTKPCARANGEDRCFFGKWQPWEECRNGVQRKQREVLQGGVACQRKGAKLRPCTSL